MDHAELAEWLAVPCRPADIKGLSVDLEPLYRRVVLQAPPCSTLVEVGSLVGKSLCLLGGVAYGVDRGYRVVGVDTCRGSSDGAGAGLVDTLGGSYAGILARNVHACGLSDTVAVLVAPSSLAATLFLDETLGFVMLDEEHDEESVRIGLESWWRKLDHGGILAVHDWQHEQFAGVASAIKSFFGLDSLEPDPDSPSCWSTVKR